MMDRNVRFVGPRERLLHLKTVPVFRELPAPALAGVAQFAEERSFRAGDYLIHPEGPVEAGFLLLSGRVSLAWEQQPFTEIKAPNNVGLLGTLARIEKGVESRALEDLMALEISAAALYRAMEASIELQVESMRAMAEEVIELRGGWPANPAKPPEPKLGTWPEHAPSLVERLLSYQATTLFQSSDLDAVAELCRLEEPVRFEAGEVIWERGAPADYSLEISSGIVRCEMDEGVEPMRIGSEYTLGLDSMAGSARRFTAVAETPVAGLVVRNPDWLAVLEDHPDLGLTYCTAMARMLVAVRSERLDAPTQLSFRDSEP